MGSDKEQLDFGGGVLEKKITIRDLVEKGATFSFTPRYDKPNATDYDEDDLFDLVSPDVLWNDCSGIGRAGDHSFAELKLKMEMLDKDGLIYKFLKKRGKGEKISPGSLIEMHYNAFWDGECESFDSTYLRQKPKKFVMGRGEVLPGIEEAVGSMMEGEQAQFVISYRLLFGERGCPPRIKPAADALFNIEVLTVFQSYNVTDRQDNEDIPFQEVYTCAKSFHFNGVKAFTLLDLDKAIKLFDRAVNLLQKANPTSEAEKSEQQKLLLKLFTNLAVCYNKNKSSRKAISMCKEVAKICDINKQCKVLYQYGVALEDMGELDQAMGKLYKAYDIRPRDTDIGTRIYDLSIKMEKAKKDEVAMCARIFNTQLEIKNENPGPAECTSFRPRATEILEGFIKSTLTKIQMPRMMTPGEILCFKNLIAENEYPLTVQTDTTGETNKVFLHKKA